MFYGSNEYNIDEKGRLVIPKTMREEFGSKAFIIKGFDGCISLFTEDDFQRYINNLEKLPYEKSRVRQYQRILLQSVVEITFDKQGRALIPTKTIREYSLGQRVLVLGSIDHVEIWDINKWNAYKEEHEKTFELDAEGVLNFDEK